LTGETNVAYVATIVKCFICEIEVSFYEKITKEVFALKYIGKMKKIERTTPSAEAAATPPS
jgi:hypothetical protein